VTGIDRGDVGGGGRDTTRCTVCNKTSQSHKHTHTHTPVSALGSGGTGGASLRGDTTRGDSIAGANARGESAFCATRPDLMLHTVSYVRARAYTHGVMHTQYTNAASCAPNTDSASAFLRAKRRLNFALLRQRHTRLYRDQETMIARTNNVHTNLVSSPAILKHRRQQDTQ
jgi:hypothetical protein